MAETPRMEFADLNEDQMEKVRALEQNIGGCVVALKRRVSLRDLSSEELERLQEAEKDLGVVLMAYECE